MMSMMMGGANYGVGATMTSSIGSPQSVHLQSYSSDPPSPAHSDSSCSNLSPTSPQSALRGLPKECGVCGDVAKSMHFGGLSCDSCKAFFRRSVQNNAYRGFSCPYERKCPIGVSSRKACQYCRFEKCLFIGMEKGWVMSEDERRKMMEQRKERKRGGDETPFKPRDSEKAPPYALSEEDRSEIARIVSLYNKADSAIPYDEMSNADGNGHEASISGGAAGGSSVLGSWMTFCKRIGYFFSLFSDFAELSTSDQALLLKTAITSACIIMGSVVYDSSNGKWAAKINSRRANIPNISSQSVEKLVPIDLITRVDKFFRKFQQICPDETMAKILILVSLYSPELMGLQARDRVQFLQERYIHILQNYVKFKFREKSVVMFPKAIVSLADIRELADRTCQMKIQQDKVSSVLPNLLHGGADLGSPFSGISLATPQSVKMEMNELVPISDKRSDICDPIYERILNVIYQMHASSSSSRHPTLLPFIIQILKKLALAQQEGKNSRAISCVSEAASPRRTHRHKLRPNLLRSGNRKKIGLKREAQMQQTMQTDELVVIKEEIQEPMDDNSLMVPMNSPCSNSSDQFRGASISPHDFMEAFPQVHNQHFQLQQSPSPSLCLDQPPAVTLHLDTNSGHHQQTIYQRSEYPQTQPQHQPDLISSHFVEDTPMALSTSSHSLSPDNGGYICHTPVAQSPDVVSQSPPITHHMSSYSPQPSLTPNFTPTTDSNTSTLAAYQQDSPFSQVLSPYSSSSSSSSPEDADSAKADIFYEDLTETEVDVLMQVMERVVNIDTLDPVNSIREILPIQLLNELQNRLCSLNSDELINSGLGQNDNFGTTSELGASLGIGTSLDPMVDMEIEVENMSSVEHMA